MLARVGVSAGVRVSVYVRAFVRAYVHLSVRTLVHGVSVSKSLTNKYERNMVCWMFAVGM